MLERAQKQHPVSARVVRKVGRKTGVRAGFERVGPHLLVLLGAPGPPACPERHELLLTFALPSAYVHKGGVQRASISICCHVAKHPNT